MPNIQIRHLGRHEDGYWIAEVSLNGEDWTPVHRKWGSWMVGQREYKDMKDVKPKIAAALQAETIKAERKERAN